MAVGHQVDQLSLLNTDESNCLRKAELNQSLALYNITTFPLAGVNDLQSRYSAGVWDNIEGFDCQVPTRCQRLSSIFMLMKIRNFHLTCLHIYRLVISVKVLRYSLNEQFALPFNMDTCQHLPKYPRDTGDAVTCLEGNLLEFI